MSVRRVARPVVLRGVPLDRHTVIEASAGTGKTFTLEHLVVELLLTTDATLDEILVVTFTEKATNELRARVRSKLEELVSGHAPPPSDDQLRAGDYFTLDGARLEKLARALRGFDGATIATIHAFCQRLLVENAFAGRRLFREEPIDGRGAFARALREALRRDVSRDPLRARWLEAALRVGWSIDRVEELLWKCLQARAALKPEFEAAALDAALEAFPVDEARRSVIVDEIRGWGTHRQTARAIASRLYEIAEVIERSRVQHDAPLYVLEAGALDLVKLSTMLRGLAPRPGPAATLCEAASRLVDLTPPFSAALAGALFPSVVDELTRAKRAAGRYDFDDMLTLVDESLRGPGGPTLAAALRRRWRYAFVDEFQDTDVVQWSIFRRIFMEQDATPPPSFLFLVGDPKQSIYRFRGADVETYSRACGEVVAAGGGWLRLDRSYRATQPLVDALNALFDPGAPEPFFTGAIDYAPVECGRPGRKLIDGEGTPVSAVHVFRFRGELALSSLGALIAREVRAITDPGRPWRMDDQPVFPDDIFVLTRTALEGKKIGAALAEAGIPFAFFKEDGLFQTAEAKDLRVVLSAIDDPNDRACRLAAWLTPFFGLPLDDIESARDLPPSHPLVERLYEWKRLADARDFDQLFESVLSDSGIVRRQIFLARGERELTNYLHLLEVLLHRSHGGNVTLRDLLGELSGLIAQTRRPVDIEGNVQRLEGERRAVQIMTIHKSKGLEARVVFLAGGLSAGTRGEEPRVYHEGAQRLAWVGAVSPEVKAVVAREEREEEQRLMYVALTRAVGRLYLPCVVDDEATSKRSGQPGEAKALRGPYSHVNRRVIDVARAAGSGFTVEDVPREPIPALTARSAGDPWRPPHELLDEPEAPLPYASLRARRAGPAMTSYTRLAGGHGARSGGGLDLGGERARDAVDALSVRLRGARASGVFLHEVLERVPLESFAGSRGFEHWRSRPDVSTLMAETLAAHRVDEAQRDHAERLVWAAYSTRLVLPMGDRIEGLAAVSRAVREMEFLYPIADLLHAASDAPSAQSRDVDGFVRGSIDLAFEHRGLTYVVDWKSDSLVSYAPDSLERHVAAHYGDQVKLYALAVVRLLGIRTRAEYASAFGGMLYCFLRGMGEDQAGLWSSRPDWNDILAWNEGLRGLHTSSRST